MARCKNKSGMEKTDNLKPDWDGKRDFMFSRKINSYEYLVRLFEAFTASSKSFSEIINQFKAYKNNLYSTKNRVYKTISELTTSAWKWRFLSDLGGELIVKPFSIRS